MKKITASELCALSLCDLTIDGLTADTDITISFSGDGTRCVRFTNAVLCELRIKGYEVLDAEETVIFDMPDVEILGDKIPAALFPLIESKPHAIGFTQNGDSFTLSISDSTDTYELDIKATDIFAEI